MSSSTETIPPPGGLLRSPRATGTPLESPRSRSWRLEGASTEAPFDAAPSTAIAGDEVATLVDSPPLSRRTEWWNTLTHGGGAVLSAVGLLAIVARLAATGATAGTWAAGLLYGGTLLYLYAASGLSHWYSWRLDPVRRAFWRRQDQVGILLMSAGSMAPLAVHAEGAGRLVFPVLTVAVTILLVALLRHDRVTIPPLWLAQLGWLPPLAAADILRVGGTTGGLLALGGGACYIGGLLFLMNDGRRWWMHPLWHLTVLFGSGLHYLFLLTYCL